MGVLFPDMLRPNMTDEDLNDIIVFLRSDAPAITAADTTIGITHLTPVGKAIMNAMARPLPTCPKLKSHLKQTKLHWGAVLLITRAVFIVTHTA